jgi:ribosomal-protein-alanine N-acetyltransferase
MELRDGDISLQEFLPEHVSERYVGWLNDPEVMGQTESRNGGHTIESALQYVGASATDRNCRFWRIVHDDAGHVGNMRLSDIIPFHRRADTAVIIGEKEMWGRGIASRAIRLASDYAFGELKLLKLTAGMLASNVGSIRAFENAGFKIEAQRPLHYRYGDTWLDGVFMGRLADNAYDFA